MVTRSPGWITRPSIRPKPPMTLAIVSFKPSEIATPPTPRAVTRVVGLMPNTGCSTIAVPVTQMVTRVRFTKIEALGICELSRTLRSTRLITRSAANTTASTTASQMSLPALTWNQCAMSCAYSVICPTVSTISGEVVNMRAHVGFWPLRWCRWRAAGGVPPVACRRWRAVGGVPSAPPAPPRHRGAASSW